jgi:adenylate cyclase
VTEVHEAHEEAVGRPASAESLAQSGGPRELLRRITARLMTASALPTDPPDVLVRKAALTLVAAVIIPLATIWVVTYAVLGLWVPASIPLAYQVLSLAGLITFLRTKRYGPFRALQLVLMLLLPFALQWSLGGFRASSAVSIWAFVAPMGALVFAGPRQAWPWFGAWAGLMVASTVFEFTVSNPPRIPQGVVITFFLMNITGLSFVTFLLLRYFVLARERAMEALDREHQLLQVERGKSERLLLNVLPEPIAARLKERDEVIADAFPEVTVLFADIVNFTPHTERVTPGEVVEMLNELFSEFDTLAERLGLEKIKTIGDAYMVAGGLPDPLPDHPAIVADMALDMLNLAGHRMLSDDQPAQLRIGIDSGPVVAGVIGKRKFIYDLWGDTVNTASRMESQGVPGCIQVTERVRDLLKDRYDFRERGPVQVKGKGEMTTYFLTGRTGQPTPDR